MKPVRLASLLDGLALALLIGSVAAQNWPTRPVRIVVTFAPGGSSDIVARLLAGPLQEKLGQSFIIDNRGGGGGTIGADVAAKAAPDGYTLLCVATSFGTNPALNTALPFDPVKSFAPVGLLATSGIAVLVSPQVQAKTMREFVELARASPGKLYYSSPGNGGLQHLSMELLKLEAGIDIVHVPYKGAGGALADLVGGHVQATVAAIQTAAPYVQSGKLRALAVMGAERSPAFPEVPTMKELGFPDLVAETWYGVFAPAGTPPEVVAKLNAELNALLAQPEIREQLSRQGMLTAGGPPEKLAELVKRELPRWARVVKAAGIKPD
jgi:tripartite-type tricarboxylate transporter receptor subunit TctC